MKKLLIGVTGRTGSDRIAGCGKSTVAQMLVESLYLEPYALADPIYAMVNAGFNIDGRSSFWSDRNQKKKPIPTFSKERDISLRYLLETLGTECGRYIVCEDIWTILATEKYKESSRGLVISDIRFTNEQEWLVEQGGFLVHVIRDNFFNEDATQNHPSNIPLPIYDRDFIIYNNCSLEELRERVALCTMKIIEEQKHCL